VCRDVLLLDKKTINRRICNIVKLLGSPKVVWYQGLIGNNNLAENKTLGDGKNLNE